MNDLHFWLLLIQGGFYVVTGLWPLLHMPSFLAVTGPKRDRWLVRTVGALILVVGLYLLVLAARGLIHSETAVLAAGCALALAVVDVTYVSRGAIDRIYLADAAVELVLTVLWVSAVSLHAG